MIPRLRGEAIDFISVHSREFAETLAFYKLNMLCSICNDRENRP